MKPLSMIPLNSHNQQQIIEVETLNVERTDTMKKIAAVIAETGQVYDLEIRPGTTCTDILNQMGKSGPHNITAGKGGAMLSDTDNVYLAVQDGGKIYIATPVEVGG